ncbi:group 1 truncated hemoglobin [Pseudomonas sp. 21LCFQ02]|uniref:group I truncated hemoglobin n=1 Tax=unclassified Pseudomonas TaxID=196821 RepID=UPI002096F951|nr:MULTISPECIES: group 1 truncated hemoglobin [unclassified Pseudomonas]MCO8164548.1 group 1 truncated hemoglobin [Pseudomonas sp. 21LCFQ010]MCO8170671.1 group 1 truncated hemoglobin [Pseudomonas sp. 21LCFQ02]MCQ9423909.1 group 1 truncated hemoglobin [Pseudomonas sp. LJDD11]
MKRLLSALLLVMLVGCAQQPQPAKDDSLYQDLGQRAGIQRIVEGMLLNVAKDKRIVERFRRVDIERLRDKLVEFLCMETGGPCTYTGDNLRESHKGQDLTRGNFNALVENLIKSMDEQNISVPVQNRLIARLAAMRDQVIHQ